LKQLIIFDLDGTLLNTISDLGYAANYALEKGGFPTHPIEEYPRYVGNGVKRLIERTLADDVRTPENVDRLLVDFKAYYNDHLHDTTTPYPGIKELVAELSNRGIKLAVASNKYQAATEELVNHFFPEIPWVAIEGQKEGIPTKPDPSIVFEILQKAEVAKADVLYIGDSGVDMETARRACVESCGVTWGFRPEAELVEHCADHIASECSTLLALATKE
jgi:phosphoglycolate phosphatase